jgi:hypothetical protein
MSAYSHSTSTLPHSQIDELIDKLIELEADHDYRQTSADYLDKVGKVVLAFYKIGYGDLLDEIITLSNIERQAIRNACFVAGINHAIMPHLHDIELHIENDVVAGVERSYYKRFRKLEKKLHRYEDPDLNDLYSAFDLLISRYKDIEQKQAFMRGQAFGIQLRHFCLSKNRI